MKRVILVGLTVLPFVAATGVGAQQSQEERPRHQHGQHSMMSQPVSQQCQEMMAMHEKMMSEMNASQEKLDKLMADMEAAQGDAKVQAMEAVVEELVAQRKAMTSRMRSMQPRMMGHMMQHMHQAMQQNEEPSEACPMMKQMMQRGLLREGQP